MQRGAAQRWIPASQPRFVDHSRDRAPQPFNLCIANATPYLPRPSGTRQGRQGRTGDRAANSSRDCYFNEISLNVGTRGKRGWTNSLEEKDEPRQSTRREQMGAERGRGDGWRDGDEMVSDELGAERWKDT